MFAPHHSSEADPLYWLRRIPPQELWRLVVDGHLHKEENGWLGYECRENGGLQRVMKALLFSWQALAEGQSLSIPLILKIHQICSRSDQKFRDDTNIEFFGLLPEKNLTKAGLLSLKARLNEYYADATSECGIAFLPNTSFVSLITEFDSLAELSDTDIKIRYEEAVEKDAYTISYIAPNYSPNPEIKVQSFIDHYHHNISITGSAEEKLEVIVTLITQLELLHPFRDYNIRTFAVVLFNFLLMQNGFPPVMMFNPNCFDGFSPTELMIAVHEGMSNTRALIAGMTVIYGFRTTAELETKFNDTCPDFYPALGRLLTHPSTRLLTESPSMVSAAGGPSPHSDPHFLTGYCN